MEVNGQVHAPAALLPGKSYRYHWIRTLDGPQSRSGLGAEEKKSHCTLRELNPGRPPIPNIRPEELKETSKGTSQSVP
jgi:hypothetical protein